MSFLKACMYCLLCYIGCIAVIDLAAVLLVTLLPGPGGRRLNGQAGFGSKILYYAVWLVAGCIAGTVYSAGSLALTGSNGLIRKQPVWIFILALVFSILLIAFFYSMGEMLVPQYNNDYYVPGHAYMTWTFFISFLVICLLNCMLSKKEEQVI
ncbi:hypothetical protein [Pseudobacter ginsenosidimutans]|uniref:Transmembrane protein n=1 Tax=Pseudobacter ginsenosidimutans TaxID=661488 RepID=A0A4Q7N0L4_9BACT|nr:hypothetical protein [Pseudobacter ginsenosidimutans]RZS75130.1 hypothetical protein EV199_0991 [Pseudobacter ginsenosidimutans]